MTDTVRNRRGISESMLDKDARINTSGRSTKIDTVTTDEIIETGNTILSQTSREYIERMKAGESILRIGPIWYGIDDMTTVVGIYFMSNKQVDTVPALRAEAAASFASTRPPADSVRVEIVIHYSRYSSHIQKLVALSQVTPVVPVMNLAITAMLQPVDTNRRLYAAYGFEDALSTSVGHADPRPGKKKTPDSYFKELYTSVPVQMKIDNIDISSIPNASRDLSVVFTGTRVLTANSYGDRVQYVRTLQGARDQFNYMNALAKPSYNKNHVGSIAALLGINNTKMNTMINSVRSMLAKTEDARWTTVKVMEILSGDTLRVTKTDPEHGFIMRIAGIRAPLCGETSIGQASSEQFGYAAKNRLRKLLPVGIQIDIYRTGTDTETGRGFQVCIIKKRKGVDTNPAIVLLREGLAKLTETNLPAGDIEAYQTAAGVAINESNGIYIVEEE